MKIVVIDGPAGAGKGTAVKLLVPRLRELTQETWRPLDTGSAYRAVGVAAQLLSVKFDNVPRLASLAGQIGFHPQTGEACTVGEYVVSGHLRSPEASVASSAVAVIPEVRTAVNDLFRRFAAEHNTVGDGRDLGSTVFPMAEAKIYLSAHPRARAERRHRENPTAGSVDEIEAAIAARDAQDQGRTTSPMAQTDAHIYVDTTGLMPKEVLEAILMAIAEPLGLDL